MLHGLEHSVSSSAVRTHDSALASVISKSEEVTIPRQTAMKRFTTLVREMVFVSKKVRSVTAPESTIQQYTSKKKGVPTLHQHKSEIDLGMNDHASFQDHVLRMDLAYLLCRVASSIRGNIMHGWTGLNYFMYCQCT